MAALSFLPVDRKILVSIAQLHQRSEESFEEDVKNLQAWMKTQRHLPEILDASRIRNFLILNKFSVERSKASLDMYYTLRSRIPDFYERMNPKWSRIKEAMELTYCVLGSKLTKENHRMVFFKLRKNLTDRLDPVALAQVALNIAELKLKEDVMFGDILIYDMEGLPMSFWMKHTPSFCSKLFSIYSKVYSIRVKGIYFLNTHHSPYLTTLLGIFKTIIKPKIFQRIHLCEDTSILCEVFPKEMIPRDYGGEEKSLEELNEYLKLKFAEHSERFDRLDTLRVNEDLRPKSLRNDDVLGIHGNFKKLDVD